MGRLDEIEKGIAKDKARLAQLEEWRKNITFFDRKDPEYVDWCTRHPSEPPSAFLKSRIKRANEAIKNGSNIKVKKGRKTGKTRFTDDERDAILLNNCDKYNIPIATNIAAGEIMVMALERGDLDWRDIVNPRHSK